MIFKVAWRNVWRNRSRSLVVIFAMIVATVSVLFMMAFSWGMSEKRIKESIEKETSHIQIQDTSFKESFEAKYLISQSDDIVTKLEADNRVKAFSKRVVTGGIAQSSRSTSGVIIYGVDKEEEMKTTGLYKEIVEGEYFGKTKSVPVVMGQKLVEHLKVGLKKKVILQFQDVTGEIVPVRVKIVGIFSTNNARFDQMNVFVPRDKLSSLLGIENGYNQIALVSNDADNLSEIKKDYELDAGNKVETWKELSPELGLAIDSFDKSMFVIVLIFFLAVALVIVNIMLMAVLERVREIGMLMAVGMDKKRVFTMFLMETIFLSLVGLPIGILLGYWLITTTGSAGIDLSGMYGEGFAGMGYSSMVYPSLPSKQYWALSIQVMAIIFLAALIPARRALKLNPATAIRKI
ncbi:MAG: ABC transporter permease [Bacteroidia bacterium]|nr:ABC transporter permease [Bacteroidia bacterium]